MMACNKCDDGIIIVCVDDLCRGAGACILSKGNCDGIRYCLCEFDDYDHEDDYQRMAAHYHDFAFSFPCPPRGEHRMSMGRGICPVCGYSWAKTKKGVLLRHHIWFGTKSEPCSGSGVLSAASPEGRGAPSLCPKCEKPHWPFYGCIPWADAKKLETEGRGPAPQEER